jgi:predicted CopG family antitoxin
MEVYMAVKTITIDMEAYNLLAAEKKGTESFSKVIKRTLASEGKTAKSFLDHLDMITLAPDTLDKVDELIAARKESYADSPPLNTSEMEN